MRKYVVMVGHSLRKPVSAPLKALADEAAMRYSRTPALRTGPVMINFYAAWDLQNCLASFVLPGKERS